MSQLNFNLHNDAQEYTLCLVGAFASPFFAFCNACARKREVQHFMTGCIKCISVFLYGVLLLKHQAQFGFIQIMVQFQFPIFANENRILSRKLPIVCFLASHFQHQLQKHICKAFSDLFLPIFNILA